MLNENELFKPYEDFVANTAIGYELIGRVMVCDYPLLMVEKDGCIKIAMIVIPTYGDKLLSADLSKTEEYTKNTIYRILTMVQTEMKKSNLKIPLMLVQCRLVYTPKSQNKQLALNKWWLV